MKFLERDFSEGPAVHNGRDTDVEMEVGVDTGVEMYVTVWTSRQSGGPSPRCPTSRSSHVWLLRTSSDTLPLLAPDVRAVGAWQQESP